MSNNTNTDPAVKGLFTTEFLSVVIAQGVGFLVTAGYIAPQNADSVTKAIVTIIGTLTILVSTVVYVLSRTKIKTSLINQPQAKVPQPLAPTDPNSLISAVNTVNAKVNNPEANV